MAAVKEKQQMKEKRGDGCWNQISNNVKQTHTQSHTYTHKFWQVVFPLAQEKKSRKTVKIVGEGAAESAECWQRGAVKGARKKWQIKQTDKSVC